MKRDDIAQLLPEVFRRGLAAGTPLFALLTVMEHFLLPVDAALEALPDALRAERAPEPFVVLLAYWTDLDRFLAGSGAHARFAPGTDQLRALIAAVPDLSRWRGTGHGMKLFLEVATGTEGFIVDDRVEGADGLPRPFHIRVTAPAGSTQRDLIRSIVAAEKPAYVTADIIFPAAIVDKPAEPGDNLPKAASPRPKPLPRRA